MTTKRLIALTALLLAGCAEKEQTEDAPVRPAAVQDARPDINFEGILGVARAHKPGLICVAMPNALQPGDALTLVTVPPALMRSDSTPDGYSSVVAARVTGDGQRDCTMQATGSGLRLPGDSVYTVSIVRDTVKTGQVYFAVSLPFDSFYRVGHAAGARISRAGDVLNFRICASAEGLHLTAWDGKPLTGKRVWHRYYYLGMDLEPTCGEKDTA
jgi:hypothetical protein